MPEEDVESQGNRNHDMGPSEPLLGNSSHADFDQSCSEAADNAPTYGSMLKLLIVDILASIAFWYVLPFWMVLPNLSFYGSCVGILLLCALWRGWQHRKAGLPSEQGCETKVTSLPYTTGFFVDEGGRELYLVATVHISPRSAADAKAVVDGVRPGVVMIELDEERLDMMRPKAPEPPKREDLQALKLTGLGVEEAFAQDPVTVSAQRAIWNAERSGEIIKGGLVFNASDPHGLQRPCEGTSGNFLLVHRGPQDAGSLATFLVKAHTAARGGAAGLVVIDKSDVLPNKRMGIMSGALTAELKLALHTRSLGFPPIPCLMVTQGDGKRLLELTTKRDSSSPLQVELEVMADQYPRRTLRRGLCHACLLFSTGVGILYGIVRLFNVEVGGEFMAAEATATEQGVPCVCIDVDMNRLWSRLLKVSMPTPENIWRVVWSWLALPRMIFRLLFPRRDNVDNMGSMLLHAKSLPLRNWVAFGMAGAGASCVSTFLLNTLSAGATDAAVEAKVVKTQDMADFQVLLLNSVFLYLFPCMYEAVLASRDEAMYRGICSKARSSGARRMVAVTGAAHTNGILQRCRDRGLA